MVSRERPRRRRGKEDSDSLLNILGVTSFECLHEPLTASVDQGESVLIKGVHSKDVLSLMKIVAGVIPPTAGVVTVLGARCNSPEGRSVVSSFGGSMGPYLGATLLQNLLLYQGVLEDWSSRNSRANEVIEEFDLMSLKGATLRTFNSEELSLAKFACFYIQRARLSCMFDQIDLEKIDNISRVAEGLANLRSQGRTFLWISLPSFLRESATKELVLEPKSAKG